MNDFNLARQLMIDEGLRLKPYRCTAGKLTIGVGRNLDDRGITEGEAMTLLNNDIKKVHSDCVTRIGGFIHMPDEVQEVLCNMCFNMGINGLLEFKNTLELLRTEKYEEAARAMLDSKWAQQVGQRAIRLSAKIAVLA